MKKLTSPTKTDYIESLIGKSSTEMESPLVRLCIDAACSSQQSVNRWRQQRRTLERMPLVLAGALIRRLLQRRLLSPSLLEVFRSSVDEIDLSGEISVNAEWIAYLAGFRHLRCLSIADCQRINSTALWPIAGLANLEELDLSRCIKVTDAGVRHLLSIPTLKKLSLSETHLTAAGVACLASLRNLCFLDLGGLPVTDQALKSLEVLTNLQHLDLWGSKISNGGVAVLRMFPKLSFLNLAWTKVTVLPNLPALECLNMSNCTIKSVLIPKGDKAPLSKLLISDATLENELDIFEHINTSRLSYLDASSSSFGRFSFLCRMKMLEYLDLRSSGLGDDSVEQIAPIGANLRDLNLSNTRISSQGVCTLVGCVPNLESLSLSHTMIDDMTISYLGMMPALKAIDLSHTSIKGFFQHGTETEQIPTLTALQRLSLEKLILDNTQVADEVSHPISTIQTLRHLSLQSCPLTDITLSRLSSLTRLKSLSMRDVVLTNDGLDSFKPPATAEILDLRGCWLLTEDALFAFRKRFPNVEIRHELVPALQLHPNLSPSRVHLKASQANSPLSGNLNLSPYFLDQRVKYRREELLALQHVSPMLPPHCRDNMDPSLWLEQV